MRSKKQEIKPTNTDQPKRGRGRPRKDASIKTVPVEDKKITSKQANANTTADCFGIMIMIKPFGGKVVKQ